MLTFTDYCLLMEMPRVAEANKFEFDDIDTKYLQQFLDQLPKDAPDKLKQTVLDHAIRKRYNKDNILKPDPEIRDILISDTKTVNKTFTGINMYSIYLAKKFDRLGYDVTKLKNTTNDLRQLGGRLAKQWLNWKEADFSGTPPKMDQSYALRDEYVNLEPETKYRGNLSRGQIDIGNQNKGGAGVRDHTSEIKSKSVVRATQKLKEPIPLDADDKAIIAYFEKADGRSVPKERDEKGELTFGNKIYPKGLAQFFVWRYSGDLFNRPEAKTSPPDFKKYPPGEYMTMRIDGKVFEGIPAHLSRLKARLADLKAQGVDFETTPLVMMSAKRWLSRGEYKPSQKASLEKDATFSGGGYEYFKSEQDKHIKDPTHPSPNIRSSSPRRHTEDNASWDTILQKDAAHAARIALQKSGDRTGQGMGAFDVEDLASDALFFLVGDEAASQPEYANQDWRISAAAAHLTNKIKKELDTQRKSAGDADMTGLGGSRTTDAEDKEKETELQAGLAKWKFPTLADVENEPDSSPGWTAIIKTNIAQYRGLSGNPYFDKIATTVSKMLTKFKELNNVKQPDKEAMKHMVDLVIDSQSDEDEEDDDKSPPPDTAMDAMRTASIQPAVVPKEEPPKPLPLKPIAFNPEEVPDAVTASSGDAKVTGGRDFKSYLAARKKANGPLTLAKPEVVPPPPEIPVAPEKKGKKKHKHSGPGLFDDY